MSVLIKGMKMPTNCDSCPCYYETEGAWRNECEVLGREHYLTEERPSWCPLVEVPPHGRLIDADALQKRMIDYGWKHPDSTVHEFLEDDAPTIIEAEEGE